MQNQKKTEIKGEKTGLMHTQHRQKRLFLNLKKIEHFYRTFF